MRKKTVKQIKDELKVQQRYDNNGCCENCNEAHPTQSHHLFVRRGPKGATADLWVDQNISQLCVKCHSREDFEMQVKLSLTKIARYDIEEWARGLDFKIPISLPSHYWEAKERYDNNSSGSTM